MRRMKVVQEVPISATPKYNNRRGNRHRGGAAAVHESPEEENPTKLLVWPGERVCMGLWGHHPHSALKPSYACRQPHTTTKPPPKPIHKTRSLPPPLPPKAPNKRTSMHGSNVYQSGRDPQPSSSAHRSAQCRTNTARAAESCCINASTVASPSLNSPMC